MTRSTYSSQAKIIIALDGNCILNLQDFRLYSRHTLQNLRLAHKTNKSVNIKAQYLTQLTFTHMLKIYPKK